MLYVKFLTVHPLKMSRYLFVATLALAAAAAATLIASEGFGLVIAISINLASAIVGYSVMTRVVLSREDPRQLPELTRAEEDPGLGHTAVIYFTHGEPETYDPIGWINQFKELDEHNIQFVPFLARPYFLHRLRKSYLRVGRSNHRQIHFQMLHSLEREFRNEGDTTTRFYISFLDDDPRPDAALIQALNEGASRIIVSEVFLTVSNHTAEGKELIEKYPLEKLRVPIAYTGPLYDSETLKGVFVHRVNHQLDGTDKSKIGILLVGHGQPDEWDAEWPTETQQELGFRRDVLDLLEADGFKRRNLSLAWMEFKQPKPAEKIEEFARNGVERVYYFSAAISADAIHSQYDVPALVHKARIPKDFPMINLGAWNDDPVVIQAIKEKIDAQIGRFSPRSPSLPIRTPDIASPSSS
jgi:protoheme ferro-lyase